MVSSQFLPKFGGLVGWLVVYVNHLQVLCKTLNLGGVTSQNGNIESSLRDAAMAFSREGPCSGFGEGAPRAQANFANFTIFTKRFAKISRCLCMRNISRYCLNQVEKGKRYNENWGFGGGGPKKYY